MSELSLKRQTEELTVRDTTLDTFILTVVIVTLPYMVLFSMYICINLLIQT